MVVELRIPYIEHIWVCGNPQEFCRVAADETKQRLQAVKEERRTMSEGSHKKSVRNGAVSQCFRCCHVCLAALILLHEAGMHALLMVLIGRADRTW